MKKQKPSFQALAKYELFKSKDGTKKYLFWRAVVLGIESCQPVSQVTLSHAKTTLRLHK